MVAFVFILLWMLRGEIVTCIFRHRERSILKDYFTSLNFFSAVLFKYTVWKVSLFNVDSFKREKYEVLQDIPLFTTLLASDFGNIFT